MLFTISKNIIHFKFFAFLLRISILIFGVGLENKNLGSIPHNCDRERA
jgi:hypothetical protein